MRWKELEKKLINLASIIVYTLIQDSYEEKLRHELEENHNLTSVKDHKDRATEPSRQVPDAISGHESLRESIGDGSTPNANKDQPSLEPGSPVTSLLLKWICQDSHGKREKQMKVSAKLPK
ncbi:hypothetical protein M0R45_019025 [Rubus argutus]|uniref:Uncharacterized protein n=1 Tax=Rubus argutus TaxID=59490 RepID=A0AAW1X662_RUBAR